MSKSAGQNETLISVSEETFETAHVEEPHGGGIKGMWKWFMQDPFNRLPFLVFVVFGFLTIIWLITYFLSGYLTGYLCAGLAAMAMSLYGANHFRTLLGLKEQVDRLHRLNNEFRVENAQLSQEVDNLTRAKDQLNNVKDNLRMSNAKLKQSLKKFQELDAHLKTLADGSIVTFHTAKKQIQITKHFLFSCFFLFLFDVLLILCLHSSAFRVSTSSPLLNFYCFFFRWWCNVCMWSVVVCYLVFFCLFFSFFLFFLAVRLLTFFN